MKSKML